MHHLRLSQRLNHLHFNWIYGGHAAVGFWVLAAMRSRSAAAAHKCPNALQQCLIEWAPRNTPRYALSAYRMVDMQMQVHITYCARVPTPCSSSTSLLLCYKCILHIAQVYQGPEAKEEQMSMLRRIHILQVNDENNVLKCVCFVPCILQ